MLPILCLPMIIAFILWLLGLGVPLSAAIKQASEKFGIDSSAISKALKDKGIL